MRRGEIRANNELLLDAAFRNPNRNHYLVVCQLIFGRFFETEDSASDPSETVIATDFSATSIFWTNS